MKRLLAIILSLAMLVSLCACAGTADEPEQHTRKCSVSVLFHL